MKVISSSTDYAGALLVKLDSGHPNLGQVAITIPSSDGTWYRVAVRLSDILANPLENSGGVDLDNILNLFVLENAGSDPGSIHVQLRNIRLQCAYNTSPEVWQRDQLCGMEARGTVLNVYVDGALNPDMYIGLSDSGAATIEEVTFEGEPVLRFAFDNNPDTNTVAFFQYNTGSRDLSAWTGGGVVEFDLYIVSEPVPPATPSAWFMKVDCFFPCGTGDVPLSQSVEGVQPPVGTWQHFSFSVDMLVVIGLVLSQVNTPLVIFPAWGNQNGAEYYTKNVRWIQTSS